MLGVLLNKGVPIALAMPYLGFALQAHEGSDLAGLEPILPKRIVDNALFFLRYGALGNAIYCSAQLAIEQKRIRQEMLNKLQYPCLLFLLCTVVCLLFGFFVLPQLKAMQFDTPLFGLIQMVQFMQFALLGTVICILVLALFLVALSKHEHPIALQCIQHLLGLSMVKQGMSLLFVQHLEAVLLIESSTKNALRILHHHPNRFVRKMAVQFEDGLSQGEDYWNVFAKREWVDPVLLRYVSYGLQGDCLSTMLSSYAELTTALWKRRFLRFGQLMQWLAYGFCALNMLVAYQVLLEPLQMLERM